jgi:hypothetical protein
MPEERPMSTADAMPSADLVFDTLFAYQRSAALKSAIDLDVFSDISAHPLPRPQTIVATK